MATPAANLRGREILVGGKGALGSEVESSARSDETDPAAAATEPMAIAMKNADNGDEKTPLEAATEAMASATLQAQEPQQITAGLASAPESRKDDGGNASCCCCHDELRGDFDEGSPFPFERRVLTTFVKPTPAQFSLVGDELLLLRALRAAAAEQLGLDYEAKTRYTSWVASSAGHGDAEEEEIERGKSEAM